MVNINQLTPGSYDIFFRSIAGRIILARDFASRRLIKKPSKDNGRWEMSGEKLGFYFEDSKIITF